MKISLYLALTLFFTTSCLGQSTYYKNFNDQNGLPSSEVYQIFQDHDGFMWFATDNGAVKFDGQNFEIFDKSNGLPDQVVFGFHPDSNDHIWFRTFSGMTGYYEKGKIIPYKFNDTLRSLVGRSICSSLAFDNLGQLWIGTSIHGISSRIDSSGQVHRDSISAHTLFLNHLQEGNITTGYSGTSLSVKKLSIDGNVFNIELADTIQNSSVISYKVREDKLYISINRNLFQYDGTSVKSVFISQQPIINLSVDQENTLWVGSLNDGVRGFTQDFSKPIVISEMAERSVTTVLQDHEGGYWISTLDKGVFYFPNREIHNYMFTNSTKVYAGDTDSSTVYTGDYKGQLLAIQAATGKVKWKKELKYPILTISSSATEPLIWLSTVSGAFAINKDGVIIKEYPAVKSVKEFHPDDHGFVWAINQTHLFKFSSTGNLISQKDIDFWGRNIARIQNTLFISGVSGLYRIDTLLQEKYEIPEFKNHKVSGVTEISGDQVLITTAGNGIYVLKRDSVIPFGDFTAHTISSIIKTDSSIWLGTEKGIVRINIHDLRSHRLNVDFLNGTTGLLADKINLLLKVQHTLWALTETGYSVIDLNHVNYAYRKPRFYFNALLSNNETLSPDEKLIFPFQKNNLRFLFGFIAFNHHDIYVRHRLNRGPWNEDLQNEISLYALAADDYDLDLQYSLDLQNWTSLSIPNRFSISPPWWETWYFLVSLFLSFGLLISFIFYTRLESFKQKKAEDLKFQAKLKSEKDRISQDLHDNIGTHLTMVSRGLANLTKELSLDPKRLDLLHQSMDATLVELRDTIWAINKDEVTIEEMEDKINTLFWRLRQNDTSIDYQFKTSVHSIQKKLAPVQAINLFRIIQEAVANCGKHSDASCISITLDCDDQRLHISIDDNGKGFTLETRALDEHYGLKNMKNRAKEIQSEFILRTKPGHGTHIEINLLV